MTKWLKVKKSPFEKGSTRVREGEGFKIPHLSGTPFYKGGLKIITAVAMIIIIGGYLLPPPVLALDYVPLAPLPVGESGAPLEKVTDAGVYIKGAFNLAIGVAAVLAIIMIVIGGIQYMSTESIGGKGAGLKRIKDAVLGLLLALGSYVILLTINPALVNFSVNISEINPPPAPTVTPTNPLTNQKWILAYEKIEFLSLIKSKDGAVLESKAYGIYSSCQTAQKNIIQANSGAVVELSCKTSIVDNSQRKTQYDFGDRQRCLDDLRAFEAAATAARMETLRIISACSSEQV
ncbi:MAG TPA: hypothetical protein VJC04_01665 [Candidatus Paceibacterota bacterium]